MKHLRFSVRTLLVLVAIAGLIALGVRVNSSDYRLDRAIESIWRDNPNAKVAIGFNSTGTALHAIDCDTVSVETATCLQRAQNIKALSIYRTDEGVLHVPAASKAILTSTFPKCVIGRDFIECSRPVPEPESWLLKRVHRKK